MIKIACCQYQIEKLENWDHYTHKIETLVDEAKNKAATILLMPEYAGIEIVCKKFATDHELYDVLNPLIPKYLEFYKKLASKYQIYIQAGTIIKKIKPQLFANRAYLFSPNGECDYQDKLQLTGYEKTLKIFQQGAQQKIFETSFGKIGIAICYDSEFPELVRRLVQQGASIILVPSYTSSLAGYHRVSLSCRARAIENQCYVATSYVINKVDLSGPIDHNYGNSGIFSPADTGFPDDGIIAQGIMNKPMLVMGHISLKALDKVRKEGQVHHIVDLQHCTQVEKNPVKTIRLLGV